MTLSPGNRIGVYEIIASIGAGGMGEVYRARDTKLDRLVALKVLPDLFSDDPERLARFEREARTLASLNHPNIAQLHGLEDSGSTRALVMELVEGEDLAARIARGPLPLDEALVIAQKIAEALEAAHERHIIHRDLKPANIRIREDGAVKVLDFGLAKALESGAAGQSDVAGDPSRSPTITTPAMTMRGMVLGTAAYMAPEQAKGKAVDRRADIWAFGCVLYEMLTGRRAFGGDDVSDTLASVLKGDVDWTGVPPRAVRLLKRCLERDPRKRLHAIGDAWDLLDSDPAPPRVAPRQVWLAWGVALLLLATTVALAARHFTESPPPMRPVRFQLPPPPGHTFDIYLTLSPDGQRLAFTARDENSVVHLWVRELDSLEARRLPGTDGAWSPFWSPDGRYLAFAVDRVLKKVAVSGGSPETIVETDSVVGLGAWNAEGTILFGTRGSGALRRVPASGGVPTPVTELDPSRSETFHSFPFFLPDGRRFVYFRQSNTPDLQGIYIGTLDAPPGKQSTTRVAATNLGPIYAVDAAGASRLLFVVNGTLVAQPFHVDRFSVSGEPVRLAEQVGSSGSFGAFSVSPTGVLVYRTGPASATAIEQLTWMNRRGERVGTAGDPRPYAAQPGSVALSPDGTRAAVAIAPTAPGPDLWLLEFAREITTRFTYGTTADFAPVWSPDGARVIFRSGLTGQGADMYVKDVDGTTDETQVSKSPETDTPTDWSHDGRWVLFSKARISHQDVWAFPLSGGDPVPLLETSFSEFDARLSPDDRWMAYVSNESGRNEVYVRPLMLGQQASVGPKWQVSNDGGSMPRWRGDGRELFYRHRSGAMMAVDAAADGKTIRTGLPRQLFPLSQDIVNWDVTSDGQRFLLSIPVAPPVAPQVANPITVVLDWQARIGH